MINGNELRIGNFIYFKDYKSHFIIELVSEEKIMIEEMYRRCDSDLIHPIPLTEDWLTRLGFNVVPNMEVWRGEVQYEISVMPSANRFLRIYELQFASIIEPNNEVHLNRFKYVHQLQNLYFSLTSEELIFSAGTAEVGTAKA